MNIVKINNSQKESKETGALFAKMEYALKSANADFEKSVRLAKTLAPILNDQTSNARHVATITSDAPIQEKVIAILMLGFPKNRPLLPFLQQILETSSETLKIASTIAISQMKDGKNNEVLCDILMASYQKEKSASVKKALRGSMLTLLDKKR